MRQQWMPWQEMQLEEWPSPDPNLTQWERGLGQLQKWEHQLKMEKVMGQEQGISKVNWGQERRPSPHPCAEGSAVGEGSRHKTR